MAGWWLPWEGYHSPCTRSPPWSYDFMGWQLDFRFKMPSLIFQWPSPAYFFQTQWYLDRFLVCMKSDPCLMFFVYGDQRMSARSWTYTLHIRGSVYLHVPLSMSRCLCFSIASLYLVQKPQPLPLAVSCLSLRCWTPPMPCGSHLNFTIMFMITICPFWKF